MSEVILFGEPMAMFVARTEGDLADVGEFPRLLAGAEVNVAIGLTRLEHSVSYVTKLGEDPFGTYIEKKLKEEGLDAQIVKDAGHFTGYQLKNRVAKGDLPPDRARQRTRHVHQLRPESATHALGG